MESGELCVAETRIQQLVWPLSPSGASSAAAVIVLLLLVVPCESGKLIYMRAEKVKLAWLLRWC
jgi:hypothetical protein